MSKELTPLEAWERANNNTYEHGYEISGDLCYIIETALKRLEELEKAFAALSKEDEKTKKLLSLEIEKNRALEIIRDKKVDVPYIIENPEEKNVIWYNARFMGVLCEGWRMLSQEEHNIVRKMLIDEQRND